MIARMSILLMILGNYALAQDAELKFWYKIPEFPGDGADGSRLNICPI
jgi:hypothetical protein